MDPNAALANIRAIINGDTAGSRDADGAFYNPQEAAGKLADYFEALDQWISMGGFLPAAWTHSKAGK